jgi:lysozyme family protein
MRLDFLKKLSTFDTFGKGWSRRVAEVKAKAISMANNT